MQAIGIDIIEIPRIKAAISRQGEDFIRRIYTDAEIKAYRWKLPSLAARFAAKEAIIKALGKATAGAKLKDIEILADDKGKPLVNLYGEAQNQAKALGIASFAVSLSHSKEYAIAIAIAIGQTK
jgi:holo-[acyl-carrier protein] synthase